MQDLEIVEEKERFKITDDGSLHWTFRKMRELKGEVAKKVQLAQADYERIEQEKKLVDEWLESETKPLNQSIEHFKQLVKDYHLEVLASDPKQKTLSSPFGKSKTTTSKPQAEKVSEEDLIKHAKANDLDEFVKTSETFIWGEFKKTTRISGDKVYDRNGAEVKGAKVKPKTVTCKVEVN